MHESILNIGKIMTFIILPFEKRQTIFVTELLHATDLVHYTSWIFAHRLYLAIRLSNIK